MPVRYRYVRRRKVYANEWLAFLEKKQADVVRHSGKGKDVVSKWFADPDGQTNDVLSVIADAIGIDVTDLYHAPGTWPTVAELQAARNALSRLP